MVTLEVVAVMAAMLLFVVVAYFIGYANGWNNGVRGTRDAIESSRQGDH